MAIVYPSSIALRSRLLLFDTPRAATTLASTSNQEEEDSQEAIKLRPLKRKQRWQWSKGDGPGEYGGPPLDFRIRRMWGEAVKDPITTTDDYIWKKDWQTHLDALPSLERPAQAPPEKEAEVGFLSLNRAISLDSMDVDLSKELTTPVKSVLALQVEAVRDGLPGDEAIKQDKPQWRMAPTRREIKHWERSRKAVPGGMAMLVAEPGEMQGNPKAGSVTARQNYLQLKNNLQLLTAVLGGAGAAIAYVAYSTEVAMSFGVGLLGALAYIRMLGNSVDAFGNSDAKGVIRGALGQPRLLVPVVLVMFFNRWNGVLAPEYGFVHLQLIPILVGFFTYKAATVVEAFRDIVQGSGEESA